jgi:hypothetical protein
MFCAVLATVDEMNLITQWNTRTYSLCCHCQLLTFILFHVVVDSPFALVSGLYVTMNYYSLIDLKHVFFIPQNGS